MDFVPIAGFVFGWFESECTDVTLAPLTFAELFPKDICLCRKALGQVMILVFPDVLLSALMKCTFVVYAMRVLCSLPRFLVLAGMKEIAADTRGDDFHIVLLFTVSTFHTHQIINIFTQKRCLSTVWQVRTRLP